jgi:hypothetical protein
MNSDRWKDSKPRMIAPHLRKSAGAMSIHSDHRQSNESHPAQLVRAKGVMLQIPLSQDAEKIRQHRSRFVGIINEDPAASPLGGAHKLGAPYSSHRAPQRVRLRF